MNWSTPISIWRFGSAGAKAQHLNLGQADQGVTSDFIYCRMHGSKQLYASGYDDEALAEWSKRVKAWVEEKKHGTRSCVAHVPRGKPSARDVFVHFDSDMKARAPADAASLKEFIGVRCPPRQA
jgi:uncharacterized protein YecE (DUF72 family)